MVFGLSGRGLFTVGGKRRAARPGSLLLYGPGDVHAIAAIPGHAFEAAFANFYWNASLAPKAGLVHRVAFPGSPIPADAMAPQARPDFLRHLPIRLDLAGNERMPLLMGELATCLPFYRTHRPFRLASLTAAIFDEIHRAATGMPEPAPTPGTRLRDWMEHHFSRNLTRAQAAREMGMGESSLNNLCLAELGVPFSRALRRFRLSRGRDLLSLGTGTVKEVARALGYDDPLHFSRLYRAEFGHPPKVDRLRK
jgi:AraC-like DNA-binding protein